MGGAKATVGARAELRGQSEKVSRSRLPGSLSVEFQRKLAIQMISSEIYVLVMGGELSCRVAHVGLIFHHQTATLGDRVTTDTAQKLSGLAYKNSMRGERSQQDAREA